MYLAISESNFVIPLFSYDVYWKTFGAFVRYSRKKNNKTIALCIMVLVLHLHFIHLQGRVYNLASFRSSERDAWSRRSLISSNQICTV